MSELATAYLDSAEAPSGPAVSLVERALLCDSLERVGPAAPTLCEGWDAHHLVAHVRGRESNPIRQTMAAVPRLGDWSVDDITSRHTFASLVDEVRAGPPRLSIDSLPRLEPVLNVLEFFIHHEDVRRATSTWEARRLPGWAEDQIWQRVIGLARLTQRRATTGVVLKRSDSDETARVSKGHETVTVRGLPGEIALYLSGRRAASRVELLGSPAGIAAYTGSESGA